MTSFADASADGRSQRNQAIDALRGVAVLLVLCRHYSPMMGFGWCGVDLFFVISGFLISGLLFTDYKKTGAVHVKRFWIRRGFKIYPSFYALILATVAMFLIRAHTVPSAILGDIFFVQNYAPKVWDHGWSLAIEEHFYLALPLLLILLAWIGKGKGNPFRAIPVISILATVACLFLRVRASHYVADWDGITQPTHLRIDTLFVGVALGYFAHFDPVSFREAGKTRVLVLGLLLALIPVTLPLSIVLGFTFAALGFGCIVAWAANRETSRNVVIRAIAWVGYYSYSIYLWHAAVMLVFYRLPRIWVLFPIFMASCIAIGVAAAKLIELPMIRIRDRVFPSPQSRQTKPEASEPNINSTGGRGSVPSMESRMQTLESQ
jgi:peptidoglycan/LPS O-acetylase OafA/YrhL